MFVCICFPKQYANVKPTLIELFVKSYVILGSQIVDFHVCTLQVSILLTR